MTNQADPQLLSLLEKAANPVQKLNMSITIKGVFSPPQQWKITDEANPNIFTYTIECLNQTFNAGKINPRQLTQQQLRQQQEAKNKKGGKKQSKQQEKPVQQDPQAQKKRLQWEALSDQQRFYRTSEDPYKMFALKFSEQKIEVQIEGQKLQKLQRNIDSGQIQIKLTRKPEINEEQIAKLKKSKPKSLNLGELYAATYIGKIKMTDLAAPGGKYTVQRIPVEFIGDVPAQCIEIKAEKCYILLEVQLDQPLFPKVDQIKPQVVNIIPQFQKNSTKKDTHSISKLKIQIIRAIKAISQQYAQTFAKDKQHQQDKKHSNLGSISTLRMNQISKKKQQFLNQFVTNGKYALLRDRMSQTIKAMCIDKFRKEKQKGPIDKQKIHKTLSELNVYFKQKFIQIVDEFLNTQSQIIHQDLVLGHETSRHLRKQTLAPIVNEQRQEKQLRLANEYQIINSTEKAQANYLNILLMRKEDMQSLEAYAKFCLKNKKFESAFILYQKIVAKSSDIHHKLPLSILLVRRRRSAQVIKLVNEIIQSEDCSIDQRITCNQLLSFMAQREGDIKLSEKYLALAQKYYQIKQNPNIKLNSVRNPYEQLTPKVPKPAKYISQLTSDQSQEIRTNFVDVLAEYGAYDLVEEYLSKLNDCFRKQILRVQVKSFKNQYEEALSILSNIIEKDPNNIDLLLMKADICFKGEKLFESQETFLFLLKLKPANAQIFSIYLRLGYTYLNRKSWDDAKYIFEKSAELRCNSALSWLGLGIANLNLGNIRQSQEAIDLSNIYNPLNNQSQNSLQKIREIQKGQNQKQYKYLKQQIKSN